MNILSNKLVIGSIVLAFVIGAFVIGVYFGGRWAYRDLPVNTVKAPASSPSVKAPLADTGDGEMVSTPSDPASTSEGEELGNPYSFDGVPDKVAVDLEQMQTRLKEWSDGLFSQFPNVPALEATVESYQETLNQVIAQNEQLKRAGVPIRERIRRLTLFAAERGDAIATEKRMAELHLKLLRENTELKVEIDRYMHQHVMLPLPHYLLGLSEEEYQSLLQGD
jgi:hypothetical protein